MGNEVEICVRAVINNGKSLDVEFNNLLFYSEYTLYYVIANEFPIRPIVKDEVYTAKVIIGAPESSYSLFLQTNLLLMIISSFLLLLIID